MTVDESTLSLGMVVIMGDGIAAQLDIYSGSTTPQEKRGERFWRRTDSSRTGSPVPDQFLPLTPLYPLNEGAENGTTAPKGYTPSNSMGLENEEKK